MPPRLIWNEPFSLVIQYLVAGAKEIRIGLFDHQCCREPPKPTKNPPNKQWHFDVEHFSLSPLNECLLWWLWIKTGPLCVCVYIGHVYISGTLIGAWWDRVAVYVMGKGEKVGVCVCVCVCVFTLGICVYYDNIVISWYERATLWTQQISLYRDMPISIAWWKFPD